ncbi:MAG TPA: NAD(P)-dependent oxidoreductase [Geminicoccaceae bacterium]
MLETYPIDRDAFDGPVLITGAGGCIGSWALALLSRAGVPAVAFDLTDDRRRPQLLLDREAVQGIPWVTGDIADTAAVRRVVDDHGVRAIVHLAALQVPFCAADPVAGARVNVVGTVNVFEAARHGGIRRIAYASSIAALSFIGDAPWLKTLYGAYKLCDESVAAVYADQMDTPSVGIRPGVVYGVGRDQGMTSLTTMALLAAAAERPFTIPFTGPVSALHAGEAASAFLRSVAAERTGAPVFDLNGRATSVEQWLEMVRSLAPDSHVRAEGPALPFPADLPDEPLKAHIGDYGQLPLAEGVRGTFEAFRRLLDQGRISPAVG